MLTQPTRTDIEDEKKHRSEDVRPVTQRHAPPQNQSPVTRRGHDPPDQSPAVRGVVLFNIPSAFALRWTKPSRFFGGQSSRRASANSSIGQCQLQSLLPCSIVGSRTSPRMKHDPAACGLHRSMYNHNSMNYHMKYRLSYNRLINEERMRPRRQRVGRIREFIAG